MQPGCSRQERLERPGPFAAPAPVPESEVVARVGGSPITALEYKQALVRGGVHLLGGERSTAAQARVIDDLVRQRLLANAGRAAGYDRDPDIADTVERMIAERYLRDLVRANKAAAPVTAAEVRAHYDAHRADFTAPRRFRAAVILIAFPPRARAVDRDEARRRAEALAERAAREAGDPEAFARLAREHSDDLRTRDRGGDLGWLPEGGETFEADPRVLAAAAAVEAAGGLAPLVETDRGIAIVRLTGREDGAVRPFDEVAADIERRLTAQRAAELYERRFQQLRGGTDVEIDEASLARIGAALANRADGPRPPAFPVGEIGASAGAGQSGSRPDGEG